MRYQFGTLEHDEAVVECIALVGFRKAGGNYAGNAFELQRGGCLLATGTASKVQSAYDDVAFLIQRVEIWIVIFKCDRCHLVWRHVVAIGVFASVNAVGVQIVFVDEENPTAHAGWKTFHNLHRHCRSRFLLRASGDSACGFLAEIRRRTNESG